MAHISIEAKEAIIAQVLSRGDKTIEQIARENGVGVSTLNKWLKRKRNNLPLEKGRKKGSAIQGQISPLQHLLATQGLDENAIGTYCRGHGIHSFQLERWREELMTQNDGNDKQSKELKELKKLRNENKVLKKELHRKDKALAETTALLVLKKKANLIWGEHEDD